MLLDDGEVMAMAVKELSAFCVAVICRGSCGICRGSCGVERGGGSSDSDYG
jgi:hypothetical protein